MANPIYSTQNIQSNIVAYEELKEYGFCREEATVDNSGGTMKLGSVLYRTVTNAANTPIAFGAWTEVAVGDLDGTNTTFDGAVGSVEVAIIIGTGNLGEALDTSQVDITTTGTDKVMLLTRGTSMVRKPYLFYTGTATEAATNQLEVVIEHFMEQVVVVDAQAQFDGTYGDVASITN